MFFPKNHLEILSIAFESTGLTKGKVRSDRLGFKEHSSFKRHQKAYKDTVAIVVENLIHKKNDPLFNYASSFQRLLNELHAPPYETEINENEGHKAYWEYLYAPMIAVLLHKYSSKEHEDNTIYFLGKFLKEKKDGTKIWPSESSEMAKWAKDVIKKHNGLVTPRFTARINDHRGSSISSMTTINNDMLLLEEDLKQLNSKKERENVDVKEHLDKVKSVYIAAMMIRRLEDTKYPLNLKRITDHLKTMEKEGLYNDSLLVLHNNICNKLLLGDMGVNQWQTNEGMRLIEEIDKFLLPSISPTRPALQDIISKECGDDVWPSNEGLYEQLVMYRDYLQNSRLIGIKNTILETSLWNYYMMYYYTEMEKFDKAIEYCKEVESAYGKVHLGQFYSATLVHKIVLHWLTSGSMKHNQFSSEITSIALHIRDEHQILLLSNPHFAHYLNNLSDEDITMIHAFGIFNRRHSSVVANPLRPVIETMKLAIQLCESSALSEQDLLTNFHKRSNQKYKRTLSILPFTRLILSDSIEMLHELFSLFGLPIDTECISQFQSNPKCKQLINDYDSMLIQKNACKKT